MMGSTANDPNKPVTGYPTTSYPPPQTQTSNYQNHHQQQQQQSAGNPSPAYNSYPASGTAYPYYAPPPAPAAYYNPNSYPPPPTNYDARRSTFLRRVIIAGISFFVLIGLITLIMWLVIRPRLPEVRVNSGSVSNFNVSSSQFTSNWNFDLLFRNPNKKITLFYDQILGSVNYNDISLTQKEFRPFYQKKKTENVFPFPFVASSTYINDQTVKEIVADRNRGGVSFNLKMVAWVRFRYGWWMRRRLVRVFCEDVKFGFSSNSNTTGKLSAGAKECEVYT